MTFEFWTVTTKELLGFVKEVGAMPFVLFQYYLTFATAPDGIRPSLLKTAEDLKLLDKNGKPSKSAVCHLKKTLIENGWIEETEGRIIIKKHLEILNGVEIISTALRNSQQTVEKNSISLRNSQQPPHTPHKDINLKSEEEESPAPAPSKTVKSVKSRISENFVLTDSMREWAKANVPEIDVDLATENFIEHWTNRFDAKAEKSNWLLTWQKGMRLAKKWQDEDMQKKRQPKGEASPSVPTSFLNQSEAESLAELKQGASH